MSEEEEKIEGAEEAEQGTDVEATGTTTSGNTNVVSSDTTSNENQEK